MVGLNDLDHSKPHVQEMIVDYLNKLVSYGVAGFRYILNMKMHNVLTPKLCNFTMFQLSIDLLGQSGNSPTLGYGIMHLLRL